jgi:hypothetical protein
MKKVCLLGDYVIAIVDRSRSTGSLLAD